MKASCFMLMCMVMMFMVACAHPHDKTKQQVKMSEQAAPELVQHQWPDVPTTPVYFARHLEPPPGRVLHGIGQSHESFLEYTKQMDQHPPVMVMIYTNVQGWGMPWMKKQVESYPHHVIPQIGMSMHRPREGGGLVDITPEIAAGEYDQELKKAIEWMKSLDRPVYLRLGYEFNGEWNQYQPESFKEAWRRFVTLMREASCENVAMVWCYAVEGMHTDYMKWYPGDEYVDWWAIDLFSPEHFSAGNTKRFLSEAYQRQFPVMIGESSPRWVGARQGQLSWETWFAPFFRLMEKNPHIKAFSYITYDWRKYYKKPMTLHRWGDARVWEDEFVFNKWKEELSKNKYIHAMSEEEITELLSGKHD